MERRGPPGSPTGHGPVCARPWPRAAPATLVVTKLDRFGRSLTDARNIVEELTETGVKLNIGGFGARPDRPRSGDCCSNVRGMIAEFESDLIRMRTRDGMKASRPRVNCAANGPSSACPRGPPRRTLARRRQRRPRRHPQHASGPGVAWPTPTTHERRERFPQTIHRDGDRGQRDPSDHL